MKVCVVIGSRSDYGIFRHLLSHLDDRFDLSVFGVIHGSPGKKDDPILTICDRATGRAANVGNRVYVNPPNATPSASTVAFYFGHVAGSVGGFLAGVEPDVVLVAGDRWEILAAVTAARLAGIQIAHLHGGETTEGAYDDEFRNAISMMASIHMPVATHYADRLINGMGISVNDVHLVAPPGLFNIKEDAARGAGVKTWLRDQGEPYLLVVVHPETAEPTDTDLDYSAVFRAAEASGFQYYVCSPNMDVGAERVDELKPGSNRIHQFDFIERDAFLALIDGAAALVGNSSAGFYEAPALGCPVIDVGSRQGGRLTASPVQVGTGWNEQEILTAIELIIAESDGQRLPASLPYPDVTAISLDAICDILERSV